MYRITKELTITGKQDNREKGVLERLGRNKIHRTSWKDISMDQTVNILLQRRC